MPSIMVTGHRPQDFTPETMIFAQRASYRLLKLARDEWGFTEAISGMALGADTWWAKAALKLDIPLAAYIPFEDQVKTRGWSEKDKRVWHKLREAAAREVVVGPHYSVGFLHARNDAMIRSSELAVAVWRPSKDTGGTASAVKKIRAKGLPLIIVDLDTQTITGERLPAAIESSLTALSS